MFTLPHSETKPKQWFDDEPPAFAASTAPSGRNPAMRPSHGFEVVANGGESMRHFGGFVHAIGGFARDRSGNLAVL
ncbi:MAG: hypothetical protein E5V57_27655, partial [Mesorhizobium sp.]